MSVDLDRLAKRGEHLRRNLVGQGWALEILEQDHELIATKARDRIAGAKRLAQSLAHFREQEIARSMAQSVIHDLDAIQIHEQHCVGSAATLGARVRLPQAIHEQRAVG